MHTRRQSTSSFVNLLVWENSIPLWHGLSRCKVKWNAQLHSFFTTQKQEMNRCWWGDDNNKFTHIISKTIFFAQLKCKVYLAAFMWKWWIISFLNISGGAWITLAIAWINFNTTISLYMREFSRPCCVPFWRSYPASLKYGSLTRINPARGEITLENDKKINSCPKCVWTLVTFRVHQHRNICPLLFITVKFLCKASYFNMGIQIDYVNEHKSIHQMHLIIG